LVPVVIAVVSTYSSFKEGLSSGRRPVLKIIAESLSQRDKKPVVKTDLYLLDKGRKKKRDKIEHFERNLRKLVKPDVLLTVC
jgi:hypothetical protein